MEFDKIIISNIKNLDKSNVTHVCDKDYEYFKFEIKKNSENTKSCISVYELPPGKSSYPYHYHVKNEEFFYIISGHGILKTEDGDKKLIPGDIIGFPLLENGAHKITNVSKTENLIYIDFSILNFPEVVFYPDSKKVGILLEDKVKRLYKEDSSVDYYHGE